MSVPRILVANDEVSELLVMRRLLRDTPYAVDTVRSASQALLAFGKQEYAAVVADDERLPDMPGASLLAEVERIQPAALRVLLARSERAPALLEAAREAHYQLIARPFFARPLIASLVEHAARWMMPDKQKREDTQKTINPFVEEKPDPTAPIVVAAEVEHTPAPGRSARRRALLTMVELVEAKAGHASGHGARVAALAAVLARELGVTPDVVEAVEDAALLHDVGELSEDFAQHVESSWQIARRAGFDDDALDGIKHHHDRWDGRGQSIPLQARIVAVADSWDALATDRPYRRAVALDQCVGTFARLSGAELDPQLVALYLDKKLYDLIDWTDPPRPGIKLL